METTELEQAIRAFHESNERLTKALWEEDARAARLYYQSEARPINEAIKELVHGIAAKIDTHRKDKSFPSHDEMATWSAILWTT